MKITSKFAKRIAISSLAVLFCLVTCAFSAGAWAENLSGPFVGFMMSPMNKKLTLSAGESFSDSFSLINPDTNTTSVKYELNIKSFYRDDDNEALFEDVEGRGQIAQWITINVPESGVLAPGASQEISYTIQVPKNAPSGGQYAAITATSSTGVNEGDSSAMLQESIVMAYTIFTEISGNTVRSAEFSDLSLPGFLLDGDIVASSKVKNTGNVHGIAKYSLQVFPLFSDEEIYASDEESERKLILPDRSLYHETIWDNTPTAGIFNVVYTVEFEGAVKQISKLIVKCPVWLLFIIIFIIIVVALLLARWLINRRHAAARSKTANTD